VPDTLTAEVTELLQLLIRNACVNDGTPESGQEVRSAKLLRDYLGILGLDLQTFKSLPGRESLVARIEGSDPTAPTLLLMGHTDVVPVNPDGWERDPHGAELVDGVIWGRGAIDMLNITASMAVAVRHLAATGFRPRGTLIYLAVADEEAGGHHGAEWLVRNARDAVQADYVVTESGGIPIDTPAGRRLGITVGEKGICWSRLRVHGTPGHGSRPLHTDNALVKAARVVQRLAEFRPAAQLSGDWGVVWQRYLVGMAYPPELIAALTDPARVWEGIDALPMEWARMAHACTHMTIAPTVAHGGTKTNVIPDSVELRVDIRMLPGQDVESVRAVISEALGELINDVEFSVDDEVRASISPVDTPLWDALARAAERLHPGARCIPSLTTGGTDARFFRDLGIPAYGFGLLSPRIPFELYTSMFHGNNERIDQESLRLSTELWEAVARDLLSG
jgi:acetylornithine deacetylase/succinyl-diaminopimelate desuccinylase-like protein